MNNQLEVLIAKAESLGISVFPRRQYTFYLSYYQCLQDEPDDVRLEVLSAVCEYALYGVYPTDLSPHAKSLFCALAPNVESSIMKCLSSAISKAFRPNSRTNSSSNRTNSSSNRTDSNSSASDMNIDDNSDNDVYSDADFHRDAEGYHNADGDIDPAFNGDSCAVDVSEYDGMWVL